MARAMSVPGTMPTPPARPQQGQDLHIRFPAQPDRPTTNLETSEPVINTSFETSFVFTINNRKMTAVEAGFVPIHGYPADSQTESIAVGIGQRKPGFF